MKTRFILSALALQFFTLSTAFSQTAIAGNGDAFAVGPVSAAEITVDAEPSVSALPSFAGGIEALTAYMRTNLKYPEMARQNGVEGTVTLEYYIKANGTIENIKVIRSDNDLLDAEAIRLAENMPRWNPAMQNGSPTTVKYQLPVTFDLRF